ncbi:hypothetical protein [Cognatiyoonia sp. IB215182]|uniref:hypothetical protein n=1 Tax=Cognatiyoonia sp. IB215182 TaxID=3097353 RepID=UPI002A0FBEC9|nr:hypothetical protein [Cognatiyoonia sp. IB215182]MDX8355317.1 hypothetical protein [Cognatiyoonia sp. IB215182]
MFEDFTIIVADDDTNKVIPTSVRTVGQELANLSELFEKLEAQGADFTTSADVKDWSNWGDEASSAIETLLNALSFRLWDGDTELARQVNFDELKPGEKISDFVKLKLVFEEPGEMVVPVPSKAQIARGKANAPLGFPEEYSGLISGRMVDALLEELEELRTDPSASQEFRDLTGSQFAAVSDTLKQAQKRLALEAKSDSDNIFLAQLGDYSVRQCAS